GVEVDRALVHAGQAGAELDEGLGGVSERNLDDVRLLEGKPPLELDTPLRLPTPEMILDDRRQMLAELLEGRERERIDDRQALGERVIRDLEGSPAREVVAVGGGERPVSEKVAKRVEEDRVGWHFADPMHELAFVQGVDVERLAQLDAARERERPGPPAHQSSRDRSATRKRAHASASVSTPAREATRLSVSTLSSGYSSR